MLKSKKQIISPDTTDTLIGKESVIEGKILSKASLRIEGKITGDIECSGDVSIGEKGLVHSNIKARNVFNAGSIHGSITTKGLLMITNTGKIYGNVSVGSLQIDEGAIFQGTSKMDNPSNSLTEDLHEVKPLLHKIEKLMADAN